MNTTAKSSLRVLLACPACKRQFDVSALPVRGRFRCGCGSVVVVPTLAASDAAVVRCSSCGGPRSAGAATCAFCSADFTVHEQDMNTICPSCMARVSDRARFCHHCGVRIAPQGPAGQPTASRCPACADGSSLHHRTVGTPPMAFLECRACAGLWLSQPIFETLLAKARTETGAPAVTPPGAVRERPAGSRRTLYRACPECKRWMHRANFGRRSGIVIDSCRGHGLWFDAAELESILDWVRCGGEARAREAEERERRREAERGPSVLRLPAAREPRSGPPSEGPNALDFLEALVEALR